MIAAHHGCLAGDAMKGAAIKAFASLEKGAKVAACSSSKDRDGRGLGAFPRSSCALYQRPKIRYRTRRTCIKGPTNYSGPATRATPLRRWPPAIPMIAAIPARPLERPPSPSGGRPAAGVEGQGEARGIESQVPTRSRLPSVGSPRLIPNLSLCDLSFPSASLF